jgi:glycosyltransferase involved in cell wall biosynthesis
VNVSVGIFCKNSFPQIANTVKGIKSQTYQPKTVFAIDCLSTDGTTEYLKKNNICVYAEKDNSPQEAFYKMLFMQKDDLFLCSLSDEMLFPGAIEDAVHYFKKNLTVDILTKDILLHNCVTGKKEISFGKPFDLESFMCADYSPHFAASFFKKTVFKKLAFKKYNWDLSDIGEYEFWRRAAQTCNIAYQPGVVSEYQLFGKQQLSTNPGKLIKTLVCRLVFLEEIYQKQEISLLQKKKYQKGHLRNFLGYIKGICKKENTSRLQPALRDHRQFLWKTICKNKDFRALKYFLSICVIAKSKN